MRDNTKLHPVVLIVAAAFLASACGTTQAKRRYSGPVIPGQEGQPDEPEEDLETVFHQEKVKAPEYVEGIEHEAQDAFRQGVQLAHEVPPKYDEALERFEKAIDIESEFLEPYFNIAMVYERQRKPEKALATYKRALSANPDSDDAKAFIGKIYLAKAKKFISLGRKAKARALMGQGKSIFDEVVARSYENVPANNALALYWLLNGDTEKAEDHVKMVLTIETDNVTALNTRGLIFLEKGKLDFAKWIFEQKVLGIDKNSIEAHTNLGTVYVRLKNSTQCGSGGCLPRAVRHFVKGVELDKSNVPARMNLGAIYIDFLNYGAAREEFEKVLEIQPDNVEAMIGLASARLGKGEWDAAITGWEDALKLDSRRSILLFRIGQLYEQKKGNTEDGLKVAIGYYERYATAAKLPASHELVRKIPVLKEVITSGMLKTPPATAEPEEGADGEAKTPAATPREDGGAADGSKTDGGAAPAAEKKPEAVKEPAEKPAEKKPVEKKPDEKKPEGDAKPRGDK